MKGAGIIIYFLKNKIPHILTGIEGKYISDCDKSIKRLEWTTLKNAEEYFTSTAMSFTELVHFDQVSAKQNGYSVNFLKIEKDSKEGIVKGGMDVNDRNNYINTINREMKEEIGVDLDELDAFYQLKDIGMADQYKIFSLYVNKKQVKKIEESIFDMEMKHKGELFYTSFKPIDHIDYKQINSKTKKGLNLFFSYNK